MAPCGGSRSTARLQTNSIDGEVRLRSIRHLPKSGRPCRDLGYLQFWETLPIIHVLCNPSLTLVM